MKTDVLLKERGVPFEAIPHPAAYTAEALAHKLHTELGNIAKTVMVRADHGFSDILAIVPADCLVDLKLLSNLLGGAEVQLASEADVDARCPDCESGVLPPFGSQYGMQTIVDEQLAALEYIIFQGATHCEAIRMPFAEFVRAENPLVAHIATRPLMA